MFPHNPLVPQFIERMGDTFCTCVTDGDQEITRVNAQPMVAARSTSS